MLYKVIGVLVLLTAGGYVSLGITRIERRRLRVLDGYISLLFYIKGQIGCYAMPMNDILASADPTLLSDCLGHARRWREDGVVYEVPAFSDMIRESRAYLEPESERLLMAFSSELGHTFREEQVGRCEHYIEALEEERRRLSEVVPLRVRMNGVLCMCCVLGMAVLLW